MIADLLRLAELGQNMDPYYSSGLQVHQNQLEMRLPFHLTVKQNHHPRNHHQIAPADYEQPLSLVSSQRGSHQQCKPLDLSVRGTFQQLVSERRFGLSRVASSSSSSSSSNNLQSSSKTRLRLQQQHQQQDLPSMLAYSDNNHTMKLTTMGPVPHFIASSTSPSSCQSSSGSSSVCSLDSTNHLQQMVLSLSLPRCQRLASTEQLLSQPPRGIMNETLHPICGSSNKEKNVMNQVISSTSINLANSVVAAATTTTTTTTTTSNNNKTGRQQAESGKRQGKKHKGIKSHLCLQCGRSFSRSDMLTRHSRLHSGLKPYQCGKCKQVFSRSDHLSTHERTHTGEKPYQCQQCSYSACRRDMITRHMRTHSGSSSSQLSPSESNEQQRTQVNSPLSVEASRGGEEEEEEELSFLQVAADSSDLSCLEEEEDDDDDDEDDEDEEEDEDE